MCTAVLLACGCWLLLPTLLLLHGLLLFAVAALNRLIQALIHMCAAVLLACGCWLLLPTPLLLLGLLLFAVAAPN